jgi:hypothetical protein
MFIRKSISVAAGFSLRQPEPLIFGHGKPCPLQRMENISEFPEGFSFDFFPFALFPHEMV